MRNEEVSKILELLTHDDIDHQRQGLALAQSFDDFRAVFKGCVVDDQGKISLPEAFGAPNASVIKGALESGVIDPLSVTNLAIPACGSITDLSFIEGLAEISKLDLSGCTALKDLDGIGGLKRLKELNLTGCSGLQNVDGLSPISEHVLVSFITEDVTKLPSAVSEMKNLLVRISAESFGTEYDVESFYLKAHNLLLSHTTYGKAWADLSWENLDGLRHDLQLSDAVECAEWDVTERRANYAEFFDEGADNDQIESHDDLEVLLDEYELFDYCLKHGLFPWSAGLPSERTKKLPASRYEADRVAIHNLCLTFSDGAQWKFEKCDETTLEALTAKINGRHVS
jgi:hypothetical protein